MRNLLSCLALILSCGISSGATWYVSPSATGTDNGTSWSNAWTGLSQISGVAAGDTVYISGGASGQSITYSVGSGWKPSGGTRANAVTYQIGQDNLHNGTAVFTSSGDAFTGNLTGVAISGDAGDGAQHFKIGSIGGGNVCSLSGTNGFRISYVNGGSQTGSFAWGNTAMGIQIDHCFFHKLTSSTDSLIWLVMANISSIPFDDTVIAYNHFEAPFGSNLDGWGDDIIGATEYGGTTIHDNVFIAYPITNYGAGQHQDGFQPLSAHDVKIYNNYYQDITNYSVYGDAIHGGLTNFFVFNNISCLTNLSTVQKMNAPAGLAIGSEMGGAPFKNVVVANNLVADYTFHIAISLGDGGSGTISYQGNVGAWNNIATFGTQTVFRLNPTNTVINLNNVNLNSTSSFVSYAQNRADLGNFRLVSGATALIGKGTNLSSQATSCPQIMFDRDGKPRPSSGAWDIGPYQFVSGPTPTPTPTPSATPTPTPTASPTAPASPKPSPSVTPTATPTPSPTPTPTFAIGQTIVTTANPVDNPVGTTVTVRGTPAGTILGSQPVGTSGIINAGPQSAAANPSVLNGIVTPWWNITFATGSSGWVGEVVLSGASTPTPTPTPAPTATPSPTPTPMPTYLKWEAALNAAVASGQAVGPWILAHPATSD